MTSTIESALERAVPHIDSRSWLRWGTATFVTVETVHIVAATLLNDWDGWAVFFENFSFVAVSGLALTALVYGVLVRWALKPSPRGRNRSAGASLGTGVLSVVGIVALFLWAHFLIAPAAVLLGGAGLLQAEEGRGQALALSGALIGVATVAFGVVLLVYAFLNDGNYPILG